MDKFEFQVECVTVSNRPGKVFINKDDLVAYLASCIQANPANAVLISELIQKLNSMSGK